VNWFFPESMSDSSRADWVSKITRGERSQRSTANRRPKQRRVQQIGAQKEGRDAGPMYCNRERDRKESKGTKLHGCEAMGHLEE